MENALKEIIQNKLERKIKMSQASAIEDIERITKTHRTLIKGAKLSRFIMIFAIIMIILNIGLITDNVLFPSGNHLIKGIGTVVGCIAIIIVTHMVVTQYMAGSVKYPSESSLARQYAWSLKDHLITQAAAEGNIHSDILLLDNRIDQFHNLVIDHGYVQAKHGGLRPQIGGVATYPPAADDINHMKNQMEKDPKRAAQWAVVFQLLLYAEQH